LKQQIDIILPCYNPPSSWNNIVCDEINYLKQQFPQVAFGLIIVNDGSEHEISSDLLQEIKSVIQPFQMISLSTNKGKGFALREGVKASEANHLLYTDIDFPFTRESMVSVIEELLNGATLVLGNRKKSYDKQLKPFRKLLSRSSHLFNAYLLRLPFTDTQGGLKAFNLLGKSYFLQTTIDRYLFDTEFVQLICKNKNSIIKSVYIDTKPGIELSSMGMSILKKEASGVFTLIKNSFK
jgi:glycosyltransferase involved in cell wall biosynthesis